MPILENSHKRVSNDNKTSIKRLAEAIAGIAPQKRSTTSAILKRATTNTLMLDVKYEIFDRFEDIFHTKLEMQPEMTEAMKINHLYAYLRKEALQTIHNINATNKRTLEDVLKVFCRRYVKLES